MRWFVLIWCYEAWVDTIAFVWIQAFAMLVDLVRVKSLWFYSIWFAVTWFGFIRWLSVKTSVYVCFHNLYRFLIFDARFIPNAGLAAPVVTVGALLIWSVVESESHIQKTLLKLIRSLIFVFMNCLTGGFCGHQSFWSHPETSGVIRSHLESSGATWSCLDLSGASGAFWNYLELSGVIWSHLELSRAIWTYLEASGAFWSQGSHLEPSEDIWRHLEPSGGIWYHLESTVAISSYLDPSESCHRGGVTICCHLVWFDVIWFVLSWVDSSWLGLRCFH